MDTRTPFSELAQLGERLEQTKKRKELAALVAEFLLALAPDEIPSAVRLIIGQVFAEWDGRALNLSSKAVSAAVDTLIDATDQQRSEICAQAVDPGEATRMLLKATRREPPVEPPLGLLEVFGTLEEIAETAGKGSRARKAGLLEGMLKRADAIEAKYLTKVIFGEVRHGVNEGIMLDGIAKASGIKARQVRRANQLWGDLGEVALVALRDGVKGLDQASLRLFRPVKAMLAQTAEDMAGATETLGGRMALEYKLDGARVQIHRRGDEVRIYSRQLSDVTASLPDVVDEVRQKMSAQEAIVEGEALAVDSQGRPLPFQHLMRRFRRKHAVAETIAEIPIELYLFDTLYLDGATLVDAPNEERWTALEGAAGDLRLVRRCIPATVQEGSTFLWPASRLALQLSPRRAGRGERPVRSGRENVQRADGRRVYRDDRASAGPGDIPAGSHGPRPTSSGGRSPVQRTPGEQQLRLKVGAALCAHRAPAPGQIGQTSRLAAKLAPTLRPAVPLQRQAA
jgi:DNA ligase-1